MCTVKSHKRKLKGKSVSVKGYSRKGTTSNLRGAKYFSDEKRQKMSNKGTVLPDGSYPIENKRDLANAISAYGRAKNPEIVKAWIKKRAKVIGATSMLPIKWM